MRMTISFGKEYSTVYDKLREHDNMSEIMCKALMMYFGEEVKDDTQDILNRLDRIEKQLKIK